MYEEQINSLSEFEQNVLSGLNSFLYPSNAPSPMSFKELYSLCSACACSNEWDLWDAIMYALPYRPQDNAILDRLVSGVFLYYQEQRGEDSYYIPVGFEQECLFNLLNIAEESVTIPVDERLAWITTNVYECGKVFYLSQEMRDILNNGAEASGLSQEQFKKIQKESQTMLRQFFMMVYNVILGQPDGPRLPNFIFMTDYRKLSTFINNTIDCANYGYYK